MHMQLARDRTVAQSLFDETLNSLIALHQHCSCALLFAFTIRSVMTKQHRGWGSWPRHQMNLFECLAVPPQDTFHHFGKIAENMKTISRLKRFWRALRGSTGKLSGTISVD